MRWNWRSLLPAPALDWIQVEITSECTAACTYCPHTIYRDVWTDRRMSLETYERLLPAFASTQLVFLQGWGEPLLHPDLMRMIRLARQADCNVGFTTNGMLLDEAMAHQLVESQIDLVAFSLAGTTPERNDAVRSGTRLETVLGAIRRLNRIRASRQATRPQIHIAYLLLRSGLDEVDDLPRLIEGLGVSTVVISTLDLVPEPGWQAETLIPSSTGELEELRERLATVADTASRSGVQVHFRLHAADDRYRDCTEHGARALFVGADGSVSPCVFTQLPSPGNTPDIPGTVRHRTVFGNVNDDSLRTIWHQRAYRAFRSDLTHAAPPPPCRVCAKLRMIDWSQDRPDQLT